MFATTYSFSRLASALVLLALVVGCQRGPTPVSGGTPGRLHANGAPLGEVRLALHARDGSSGEIGFAISRPDGSFALLQPNAAGPLHLPSGDYRVTLESVGVEPLRFPKEYGDPKKSPLVVTFNSETPALDLQAPAPR